MSGFGHTVGRWLKSEPPSMESQDAVRGWTSADYRKRFDFIYRREMMKKAADSKSVNPNVILALEGLARLLDMINLDETNTTDYRTLQAKLGALLLLAKDNPAIFASPDGEPRKILQNELNVFFNYVTTEYRITTTPMVRDLRKALEHQRAASTAAIAPASAATAAPSETLLMLQERLRLVRGELPPDTRTSAEIVADLEARMARLRGHRGGRRNTRRQRNIRRRRSSRRNNDFLEHGI